MDEKEAEARPVMGTIFLVHHETRQNNNSNNYLNIPAKYTYFYANKCTSSFANNWASEASPTLGCSIEISYNCGYVVCCRMSEYVRRVSN